MIVNGNVLKGIITVGVAVATLGAGSVGGWFASNERVAAVERSVAVVQSSVTKLAQDWAELRKEIREDRKAMQDEIVKLNTRQGALIGKVGEMSK